MALSGCVPYGGYGTPPYGYAGGYYGAEAPPGVYYAEPSQYDGYGGYAGYERPRYNEGYGYRGEDRQVSRQQQGYNQALLAQQQQRNAVVQQQQQYNNAVVAQQNAYNQALLAQQRAAQGR